ncbi:MAG: PAS domain S-box protein, partial [Bacteroidota bacterium]|nr:PAS domain S-box protein [Bacteroidota bacterium]
ITHPDYLKQIKKLFDEVIKGNKSEFEIKKKCINKSGVIIDVFLRAKTITQKENKSSLIIGIISDITDTEKIKKSLHESENRLSKIIEASNDGMWDWDLKTDKVYFDDRYYQMAGYEPNEFPHEFSEFSKRVHPEDIDSVLKAANDYLKGKSEYFKIEFRFKKKNNDWLCIQGIGKIVEYDKDGKPLRFIGTHTDISKRKKIEDKLKASEEKYRSFFKTSQDCIFISSEKGKWIDMSDSAPEFFGYRNKEELKKINTYDLYKTVSDRDTHINEMIKQGFTKEYPIEMLKKDGSVINTLITSVLIKNEKTNTSEFQGVIRDITEKKKVEKKLKENEKFLKELNATKDRFFSIIAHDLKSPFNSILGFLEIIINEFDNFKKEEILQMIKNVSQSSNNAYRLLNNLLEWSKIQRNSIEINAQVQKINDIVQNNISFFEVEANKRKITLINNVDKTSIAFFDKNTIDTVIRNLISNAINFTPENGKVTISSQSTNNHVEISVSDTGVGMKKEKIDLLFRIDKNIASRGLNGQKGTGLGLILCNELVKKNEGNITIESKEGQGSKFIFTVPKS